VVAKCVDVKVDMQQYRENRDILCAGLAEAGYKLNKPEGAFYLFPQSPIPDDAAFCEMAKKHNILIVPGRAFGCPGYFRIAYCVEQQRVTGSLDGFAKLVAEVK
jgi:aspartate aminotransferase